MKLSKTFSFFLSLFRNLFINTYKYEFLIVKLFELQ